MERTGSYGKRPKKISYFSFDPSHDTSRALIQPSIQSSFPKRHVNSDWVRVWFSYVLVCGIQCRNYFTDFRLLQEGKKLKTLQPSSWCGITLYYNLLLEDLRQQWPEPGCWPAVFVKTMICWGAQSRGLRKPGCGYLRFFSFDVLTKIIRACRATWGRKCRTLIRFRYLTVFEHGISIFANFWRGNAILGNPNVPLVKPNRLRSRLCFGPICDYIDHVT